jgi:hypothetical protein
LKRSTRGHRRPRSERRQHAVATRRWPSARAREGGGVRRGLGRGRAGRAKARCGRGRAREELGRHRLMGQK